MGYKKAQVEGIKPKGVCIGGEESSACAAGSSRREWEIGTAALVNRKLIKSRLRKALRVSRRLSEPCYGPSLRSTFQTLVYASGQV